MKSDLSHKVTDETNNMKTFMRLLYLLKATTPFNVAWCVIIGNNYLSEY